MDPINPFAQRLYVDLQSLNTATILFCDTGLSKALRVVCADNGVPPCLYIICSNAAGFRGCCSYGECQVLYMQSSILTTECVVSVRSLIGNDRVLHVRFIGRDGSRKLMLPIDLPFDLLPLCIEHVSYSASECHARC